MRIAKEILSNGVESAASYAAQLPPNHRSQETGTRPGTGTTAPIECRSSLPRWTPLVCHSSPVSDLTDGLQNHRWLRAGSERRLFHRFSFFSQPLKVCPCKTPSIREQRAVHSRTGAPLFFVLRDFSPAGGITGTSNASCSWALEGDAPATMTSDEALRLAFQQGSREAFDLMSWGPSLLVWGALLYFPARLAWRKLHPEVA